MCVIGNWSQSRGRSQAVASLRSCPGWPNWILLSHYIDVIMTTMASQITNLMVVYSTVYSDADQRKHQNSASLAFVWGIHRTIGQLRGNFFHLMTSSCNPIWSCAIVKWSILAYFRLISLAASVATLIASVIGVNMGPIWGRQDPGGPHVGPRNFAIRDRPVNS